MIPQGTQQPMQQPMQPQMPQQGIAPPQDWSKVPPDQLMQMASDPQNAIIQLAALGEVQKRKNEQLQSQAQRAKGQPQQTVAQQVLQGMPPPQAPQAPPNALDVANPTMMAQGIPQLPTGQAIPQQYAGGGIVAFSGGSPGEFLPGSARPISQFYGTKDNTPERTRWSDYLDEISRGAAPVLAAGADVATMIPRGLMGAGNAVIGGVRALGGDVPYMADILAPEGSSWDSATPFYDRYVRGQQHAGAASANGTPWSPPQSQALPTSQGNYEPKKRDVNAGAGIASLQRGAGGAGSPRSALSEWIDPRAGAPEYQTEEQRAAVIEATYQRIKKERGPDAAEEFLKEIKAEREGLSQKYADNQNRALLRTGLAIMGGKSKYAAQNIGAGGIAGLDAFEAGETKLDALGRELRRQEMEGRLGVQNRDIQARSEARTQGNEEVNRMDRGRAEHIATIGAWNNFRQESDKLGIENRKVDAMFANVNAEYAKIRAIQAANKDDKILAVMDKAFEGASKSVVDRFKDNPQAMRRFADDPRAFMALVLPEYEARVQATLEMFNEARGDIRGGGGPAPRLQWPGAGQSFPTSRAPR
jgi:hypothetical protein